jgi:hypothetical protein
MLARHLPRGNFGTRGQCCSVIVTCSEFDFDTYFSSFLQMVEDSSVACETDIEPVFHYVVGYGQGGRLTRCEVGFDDIDITL